MPTSMVAYFKLWNIISDVLEKDSFSKEDIFNIKNFADKHDISAEDFADANDCGSLSSWEDILFELKDQIRRGERE